MKITIRQLEVFDAVAKFGSVTRAAEELGMSQSAASGALSDLQIILRRPLFLRSKGRPLQITDEGRRLRARIRSMVHELKDIENAQDHELGGTLVVGATAMLAETVLPAICAEFIRAHPQVRIQLLAATAGELYERVSNFSLETAILEYFPDLEGLELTKWRQDELWLVVAPEHPLAKRRRLRIRDLKGSAWCTREIESSVPIRLRVLLHEEMGQQKIAFEATSNTAVRLGAMANCGIACLSRESVRDDVDAGRLVRLNVTDFHFTRSLSLARPRGMWRSPLVQTFDAFLLERGDPPATEPDAEPPPG